ncbi:MULTISPECIES: helix-turn-helix domain-containing protein [Lactobacillus]|uniref:Rgg/GadR/MutR family transcriptional regulator n=1 Tax=Lactobacillus xujianguonis TaxID=2495899 RepID=A0A437STK7_9LACO|nr:MULTISPECIES: Rgg/GadR/MutR family transcriptional regulator [Lactobacillus]RVU70253.1 Rgg/GadR/MutR family transcriptional regulator [Lactobacillus xujianguonis]RVU72088.1 Rgg/GadR/MutR family transcriptional regulator [Lactobacillus xujianguonis]
MTIGEALKKKRQELGLSQTEMAAGVLTKSYYSKVERGLHEIKTVDLLEILAIHHVNANEFLEQFSLNKIEKSKSVKYGEIIRELHKAYYSQDLEQINEIRTQLKQEKQTKEIENLDAQAAMLEVGIKKDPNILSKEDKYQVRNLIFKTEEWNQDNLTLFSIAIPLFDFGELKSLVKSIFKNFKDITTFSNTIQEKVAAIAVNYLQNMLFYHYLDQETLNLALNILKKMTPSPSNCFAKIMASYYTAVFSGDKDRVRSILMFLRLNGMDAIVEKLKG